MESFNLLIIIHLLIGLWLDDAGSPSHRSEPSNQSVAEDAA
jgi:hypothetical protein